jgi:hypothetical protein
MEIGKGLTRDVSLVVKITRTEVYGEVSLYSVLNHLIDVTQYKMGDISVIASDVSVVEGESLNGVISIADEDITSSDYRVTRSLVVKGNSNIDSTELDTFTFPDGDVTTGTKNASFLLQTSGVVSKGEKGSFYLRTVVSRDGFTDKKTIDKELSVTPYVPGGLQLSGYDLSAFGGESDLGIFYNSGGEAIYFSREGRTITFTMLDTTLSYDVSFVADSKYEATFTTVDDNTEVSGSILTGQIVNLSTTVIDNVITVALGENIDVDTGFSILIRAKKDGVSEFDEHTGSTFKVGFKYVDMTQPEVLEFNNNITSGNYTIGEGINPTFKVTNVSDMLLDFPDNNGITLSASMKEGENFGSLFSVDDTKINSSADEYSFTLNTVGNITTGDGDRSYTVTVQSSILTAQNTTQEVSSDYTFSVTPTDSIPSETFEFNATDIDGILMNDGSSETTNDTIENDILGIYNVSNDSSNGNPVNSGGGVVVDSDKYLKITIDSNYDGTNVNYIGADNLEVSEVQTSIGYSGANSFVAGVSSLLYSTTGNVSSDTGAISGYVLPINSRTDGNNLVLDTDINISDTAIADMVSGNTYQTNNSIYTNKGIISSGSNVVFSYDTLTTVNDESEIGILENVGEDVDYFITDTDFKVLNIVDSTSSTLTISTNVDIDGDGLTDFDILTEHGKIPKGKSVEVLKDGLYDNTYKITHNLGDTPTKAVKYLPTDLIKTTGDYTLLTIKNSTFTTLTVNQDVTDGLGGNVTTDNIFTNEGIIPSGAIAVVSDSNGSTATVTIPDIVGYDNIGVFQYDSISKNWYKMQYYNDNNVISINTETGLVRTNVSTPANGSYNNPTAIYNGKLYYLNSDSLKRYSSVEGGVLEETVAVSFSVRQSYFVVRKRGSKGYILAYYPSYILYEVDFEAMTMIKLFTLPANPGAYNIAEVIQDGDIDILIGINGYGGDRGLVYNFNTSTYVNYDDNIPLLFGGLGGESFSFIDNFGGAGQKLALDPERKRLYFYNHTNVKFGWVSLDDWSNTENRFTSFGGWLDIPAGFTYNEHSMQYLGNGAILFHGGWYSRSNMRGCWIDTINNVVYTDRWDEFPVGSDKPAPTYEITHNLGQKPTKATSIATGYSSITNTAKDFVYDGNNDLSSATTTSATLNLDIVSQSDTDITFSGDITYGSDVTIFPIDYNTGSIPKGSSVSFNGTNSVVTHNVSGTDKSDCKMTIISHIDITTGKEIVVFDKN